MISVNHKLKLTYKQEQFLNECLWHAIGIENWVINQIKNELDNNYFPLKFMKPIQLRSVLSAKIKGHAKRSGISSKLINDCIDAVIKSFSKTKNIYKVKYKSVRKKSSFYFNGSIKLDRLGRLKVPGIKTTFRMSEMNKYQGKLKKVTLIKKYNGWYACCVYDEVRKPIEVEDIKVAGIDPGLKTTLVFSDGNEIDFPKWYQEDQKKLAKMQRKSKKSKKVKALHRRIFNRRADHHHKLSTDLAKRYQKIYWSNDNFKVLNKRFGKSYSNLGLGEFRNQLSAKLAARNGGLGELVLVDNRYSTKTCSACGSLSGPSGWNGLQVRQWCCDSCGAIHDRDINAAINTLLLGEGITSELGKFVSRRSDFGFWMNSVNQRKPL